MKPDRAGDPGIEAAENVRGREWPALAREAVEAADLARHEAGWVPPWLIPTEQTYTDWSSGNPIERVRTIFVNRGDS